MSYCETNSEEEKLAFVLSEIMNNAAPIGWRKYIPYARCLLDGYIADERNRIADWLEKMYHYQAAAISTPENPVSSEGRYYVKVSDKKIQALREGGWDDTM